MQEYRHKRNETNNGIPHLTASPRRAGSVEARDDVALGGQLLGAAWSPAAGFLRSSE